MLYLFVLNRYIKHLSSGSSGCQAEAVDVVVTILEDVINKSGSITAALMLCLDPMLQPMQQAMWAHEQVLSAVHNYR
jgi:hypothetical protein